MLRSLSWMLGLFSVLSLNVLGQSFTIPAQDDPEGGLILLEYYFDIDPGQGEGTPIPFQLDESGKAVLDFEPDLTGLEPGAHHLHIRGQNGRGQWGMPWIHTFRLHTFSVLEAPPLAEAEYYLGADPGLGNGIPLELDQDITQQLILSATGPLTGNAGSYDLVVRAKDALGNWGHPHRQTFYLTPFPIQQAPLIVRGEYFLGEDPGIGQGIAVEFTGDAASLAAFTLELSNQATGHQSVGYRVQDEHGNWSLPTFTRFFQLPDIPVTEIQWTLLEGETVLTSGTQRVDPPTGAFETELATDLLVEPSFLGRDLTLHANLVLADKVPTPDQDFLFNILSIADPIEILEQPQSQTLVAGQTLALSVGVTGTGPFEYQWRKNGEPLAGETGEELIIVAVAETDAGAYTVRVSNEVEELVSQSAEVIVTPEVNVAGPHPADSNGDFVISIGEVTAYGAAWKRGDVWPTDPNPIPIGYVTRAGALWKGGESYEVDVGIDSAPLWWVNQAQGVGLQSIGSRLGVATRSIDNMDVTIEVRPSSMVGAYAIEEKVPSGFKPTSISDQGSFDSNTSTIKWGPYLDSELREVGYALLPHLGETSAKVLSGLGSYDGLNLPIGGESVVGEGNPYAPRLSFDAQSKSLLIQGYPGERYSVQTTSDPVSGSWQEIAQIVAEEDVLSWADPDADDHKVRFYRAIRK